MEQFMKDNGLTIFVMELVHKSGQTVQNTKDIGAKTKPMVKAN